MELVKNYSNFDLPQGWQARLYLPQKRTITYTPSVEGFFRYGWGDDSTVRTRTLSLPHMLFVRIKITQKFVRSHDSKVGLAVYCTSGPDAEKVIAFPMTNVHQSGATCLDMDNHYKFSTSVSLQDMVTLFWEGLFLQKDVNWMDAVSPTDVYEKMKYYRYPVKLSEALDQAYLILSGM